MQASAEILTEEKKPRVDEKNERNLCAVWMGLEKLAAWEAMSPEVSQLFVALLRIANITFIDGRRFPDALKLTNKALLDKNGAGSPDGLRRRRRELAAIQINGEALVEIEEGENKGSQTTCIYRINYDLILSAWNPMRNVIRLPSCQEPENHPCEATSEPLRQCGGEGGSHPLIEKKESTLITPSVVTTSSGQKSGAPGVGTSSPSSKTLEEDLESLYPDDMARARTVLDTIGAWKVRDLRSCFCRPLTDMWRIIRQFEADFTQKHNIRNPGAVLRKRLIDGIETWDEVIEMGSRPADVSPEVVEDFQQKIDREFDAEDGDRKYLLGIVSDFRKRANVTLEKALPLLNLHGATRDQLFEWNGGC